MKSFFRGVPSGGVFRVGRNTVGIVTVFVILSVLAGRATAEPTFGELVKKLPKATNAVVLLNVEKIKASPMAVAENWAENMEKSFDAGLTRIPPHATRFIIGSELDPEFMTPIYETAVVELDMRPSLDTAAKVHGGTRDKLGDFDAVVLPNDTYAVQFDPTTVGVMRPANRQAVLRWLDSMDLATGPQLSPYITKAAGYSDEAGSEIIMAVDLQGAFSWERGAKYVNRKKELLDKYGVDVKDAANLMATLQGVRLGVRLSEKPVGKVSADFGEEVKLPTDCAKQLMLEIFADAGVLIPEFEEWACNVNGTEVSLTGVITREGLRRLGSLIDSPSPHHMVEDEKYVSPGDEPENKLKASKQYFTSVTSLFNDIKSGWRDLKSLSSGSVFLDRYSQKIAKLPILNVDPELLNYGQYVSQQLRAAAGAVRTMGIRGGARQAQISGYDVGPEVVSYGGGGGGWPGWGGYRYGWAQAYYPSEGEIIKEVGAERRKVRAEERGIMATDVSAIRDQILQATEDIRRKMTEKYQSEF